MENFERFLIWKVVPVGVCAWVMERLSSISLRMSGFISLECGQRICMTLVKKVDCSTVKTENT